MKRATENRVINPYTNLCTSIVGYLINKFKYFTHNFSFFPHDCDYLFSASFYSSIPFLFLFLASYHRLSSNDLSFQESFPQTRKQRKNIQIIRI